MGFVKIEPRFVLQIKSNDIIHVIRNILGIKNVLQTSKRMLLFAIWQK